jgi:hypothetical protein
MIGHERYDVRLIVNDENELAARRGGVHAVKPEKRGGAGQPTNVTIAPRFVISQCLELRSSLQTLHVTVHTIAIDA